MSIPERVVRAAQARIEAAKHQIQNTLTQVDAGRPLQAETDPDRAADRVAAVADVSVETAARIVAYEDPAALGLTGTPLHKAEAIQGKTVDFLNVGWLDAGRAASNAVGRIVLRSGRAMGTGFLVSDRLLLTNNHVIPTAAAAAGMLVEFRYELRAGGVAPAPVRFELDPSAFFETDEQDDLDYTLIALGRPIAGGAPGEFGCCPLSASGAKHSIGEPVNIVQHPSGEYKQIVVRENRILHRGETVLHYLADTEPGSSGSPVFNDEWQVVALHHWGGPHREVEVGGRPLNTNVNEGIRISAIVKEIEGRAARMDTAQRGLWRNVCNAPPPPPPGQFGARVAEPAPRSGAADTAIPSRAHVGISERGGAPASRIDPTYSNRRGYNSRFLPNFPVPMPQLNADHRSVAARVGGAGANPNPFELKYQHFSVVLNGARRMPFFSICNIDGAKRIRVDRKTGLAKSEPEATENWALDPRVPEETQLSDAFYDRLRNDLKKEGEFFARGHLTRREDPNWGAADLAERANDDTYHHTNACPQVQLAFNGSQKAWQGIENFVLNSADDSNLKVTVITGAVFRDDDPEYEDEEFGGVRIPRRFWKVVVRVEDGTPIALALLADQSEAMDALFAARRAGPEAAAPWVWPTRLSREYISTVATIAELTGLDFGNLADHDAFARGGGESLTSPRMLFPRRGSPDGEGFGRFTSIGDYLDEVERRAREAVPAAADAENAKKKKAPKPRTRKVVEIEGRVERVFADDLSGSKHQQFTVVPTDWIAGDAGSRAEVESMLGDGTQVRIAVRFGDSRGLADRVPSIRTGVDLRLKGEWISAEEAFAVAGERMAVLHFTHDPLGWICTPAQCFS